MWLMYALPSPFQYVEFVYNSLSVYRF